MKKMRKVFLSVVCIIVIFAISTCAYAKKPSKAKVKAAYKEYIAKEIVANDSRVRQFGGKEHYIDLNRDGIQELFYVKGGYLYPMWEVCTYKKGQVVKAGEFPGSGGVNYNTRKKMLCVCSKAAVGSHIWIYKMKGTKLVCTISYLTVVMLPNGKYAARKNDKVISSEQLEKETSKYFKWKSFGW